MCADSASANSWKVLKIQIPYRLLLQPFDLWHTSQKIEEEINTLFMIIYTKNYLTTPKKLELEIVDLDLVDWIWLSCQLFHNSLPTPPNEQDEGVREKDLVTHMF